ncbi:MAG: cation-translocating P-type ATPase [Oscillospiraceae bacterium]|nr:cation-translocating P-type ATPase [Oscillospiraceae bacterium]
MQGLCGKEAARRLGTYGPNQLAGKRGKGALRKFAEQFSDFMVLILIGAALLSLVISFWEGERGFLDPIIILAIVLLNAVMGVIQEARAERAIQSLQALTAPKTRVMRDGIELVIDSLTVVPGDVLLFETGDAVTADARILESVALRVEESGLTGESVPVNKDAVAKVMKHAPIGERWNMVFSSSVVVGGRCRAVVTATGMGTEVGKIAELLDRAERPQTPLQRRLAQSGKIMGVFALLICGFLFILSVTRQKDILDSFMLAVSLAVAAVPEGLPAIVTIVLALGVQRMVKRGAIVRKLPAVETLGSATVICSDKTGTLTQNKMTVKALATATGGEDGAGRQKLLLYGALCTNTRLTERAVLGDPTEAAIVEAAMGQGLDLKAARVRYPRRGELPFESGRKRMSTLHRGAEGDVLIVKGAPDILLGLCEHYDSAVGTKPLTEGRRREILGQNARMAEQALRVIAVAYKQMGGSAMRAPTEEDERGLAFLGLIALQDPPRPEAKAAVLTCKRAGIRPVMITGDHAATAAAIARELGILGGGRYPQPLRDSSFKEGASVFKPSFQKEGARSAGESQRMHADKGGVLTGQKLDQLSDEELRRAVKITAVFARVSPEHKSRVVRALQENGEIVAMTGDGVNDAPALKIADIGCAMGKTGTDVARDASDMILTDDNFATIVAAVKEGRGIYQNMVKSVHFLLSCNVGEILTVVVAILMGMPAPLLPIQLLWVNLVTDSFPALALGAEKSERDIMDRPPVDPKSSMFAGGLGFDIFFEGLMIGGLSLWAFFVGIRMGDYTTGRTFAFAVLAISQLFHAFGVRSKESLFRIGIFSNSKIVLAFFLGLAMQVTVIGHSTLAEVFGAVPLTWEQWRIVALMAPLPLVVMELTKLFVRRERRRFAVNR